MFCKQINWHIVDILITTFSQAGLMMLLHWRQDAEYKYFNSEKVKEVFISQLQGNNDFRQILARCFPAECSASTDDIGERSMSNKAETTVGNQSAPSPHHSMCDSESDVDTANSPLKSQVSIDEQPNASDGLVHEDPATNPNSKTSDSATSNTRNYSTNSDQKVNRNVKAEGSSKILETQV